MFSISMQPQLNNTVFFYTRGLWPIFWRPDAIKYGEEGSNVPKIPQFTLFRCQGGAIGKNL